MKKISVDFKKDENNNYIVEKVIIQNTFLTENSICWYCPFYTGSRCQGHGEFYGSCTVYDYIDISSNISDSIVNDRTKCKVFQYLKSLDSDY